jgi:hypothetical protein
VFRTISYARQVGNNNYAAAGETIVCAIEFAELNERVVPSDTETPASRAHRTSTINCR